jgi:membrane protein YqaA with SNARE-associated domain
VLDLSGLEATVGLHAATFIVCLLSGLIPIVNAEIYLLSVGTLVPPDRVLGLLLPAVAGQAIAKSVLYFAGSGAIRLPKRAALDKLAPVQERLAKSRFGAGGIVLLAGAVGLPPLYLTSIAAGALRVRYVVFLVAALAGRTVRFGVLLLSPGFLRGVLA